MRKDPGSAGFTLVEVIVSMAILAGVGVGLTGILIDYSRMNRQQQLRSETQANARNSLSIVVERLRSAGWDPVPAAIPIVALDPDPLDAIDQIEIFADLDGDGFTTSANEQVLIRHVTDRLEWRTSAAGAFETFAANISNDADGDGTREPLFTPIPPTDPVRIRVQITARSAAPDPDTGDPIRYTVTSDVVLRKALGS